MKIKQLMLLLTLPIFAEAQNTNINGVVTYFFNDNLGDKPDIGAKVYVVDSLTNTVFKNNTIDSFIYVKTYRRIYQTYLRIFSDYTGIAKGYEGKKKHKEEYQTYKTKTDDAKKNVDEYFNKLLVYGIDTDEKFEALDKRAAQSIVSLNENNSLVRTVDGNGNYSISVKPGTYFILIISKGRTGMSISEVMGQIYSKKVLVREGETKNVSNNFTLY